MANLPSIDWLRQWGAEPQWFGLGFIQLKFLPTSRLHFYIDDADFSPNVGPDEVHTHRYDFTSHILAGTLTQTIYSDPAHNVAGPNVRSGWLRDVSCAPGEQSSMAVPVKFKPTLTMNLTAGSSYTIPKDTFHDVKSWNAVTRISRPEHATDAKAYVIAPTAEPLLCPFRDEKSVDELWQRIRARLDEENSTHGF